MAIRGLKFSTEVVAAFNRRDAARLVRQITDALAESNSSAVNLRVALRNDLNGPGIAVSVGGVQTLTAPLRSHQSTFRTDVGRSDSSTVGSAPRPPACWECRENGEPWEHDCDQCNPDGIYDTSGREKVQS